MAEEVLSLLKQSITKQDESISFESLLPEEDTSNHDNDKNIEEEDEDDNNLL